MRCLRVSGDVSILQWKWNATGLLQAEISYQNCSKILLTTDMVNQSDIVKPKSLEDCGSHGNADDEFEEYSEEEMLSEEEESNENLCMRPKKEGSCAILSKVEGSCAAEPIEGSSSNEESADEVSCGDESDDEDSCPEEPNEEDPDEEFETASAEYLTQRTTLEEASDEDPSDVSFEDIIEEEFHEESDVEPNGEEPLRGSMDQPPLIINSDGVPCASDHIFSESKASPETSSIQCLRESTNRSTDAIVSKQLDDPLASCKKRRSRWDIKAEAPLLVKESGDLDKKRKTRWSNDTNTEAPIVANNNTDLNKRRKTRWSSDETHLNMPCIIKLPDSVKDILSASYNDQRIQKLNANNKKKDKPKCSSEHHYTFCKKLYIPLKEYPNYNFVGLILGPNGNTLKKMEEETGSIILLRGKGSKGKKPNADDHDDLHVLIQSDSQTCLDAAAIMVEKLLVPVDDRHNYHKAAQLRELAELRGTLNEGGLWEIEACDICGQSSHPTSDCPLIATASKDNANFHTGSGSLFSSFKSPFSPSPVPFVAKAYGDEPKKENDPAKLFVGRLPQSVSTDKLKELFLPYGSICGAIVMKDKSTGRSKGSGIVKYASASDAAKAIEKMNGYMIDGRKLAVRIAGRSPSLNANLPIYPGSVSVPTPSLISNLPKFSIPPPSSNVNLPNYLGLSHPSTSNANLPSYPGLPFTPSNANLPNYPKLAAIPQEIPKTNSWPGPPGSMLPESSISFPKSSYNSVTYTETVPLQPSTFLGSTFQTTSLLKNGYMMDEKKLNVAVAGTPPPSATANLPNYPRFAAIPREIRVPNCWPSPPGCSMLPESGTHFPKSNYISSKYTESVPFRSLTYLDSTSQTSISSSQFPGVTATSSELASFPGYLKSFDSPGLLDQSMPSTNLLSPYFIGKFSGNQMNPTRR